jgi:hypothetical protein
MVPSSNDSVVMYWYSVIAHCSARQGRDLAVQPQPQAAARPRGINSLINITMVLLKVHARSADVAAHATEAAGLPSLAPRAGAPARRRPPGTLKLIVHTVKDI